MPCCLSVWSRSVLKNLSARAVTIGSPGWGATSDSTSAVPVVEKPTKAPAARALLSNWAIAGTDFRHAGRGGQTAELISRTRNAVVLASTVTGARSGRLGSAGGGVCAKATSGVPPISPTARTDRTGMSSASTPDRLPPRYTDFDIRQLPLIQDDLQILLRTGYRRTKAAHSIVSGRRATTEKIVSLADAGSSVKPRTM